MGGDVYGDMTFLRIEYVSSLEALLRNDRSALSDQVSATLFLNLSAGWAIETLWLTLDEGANYQGLEL